MGGEFGGEWIHICAWLSPFARPLETITTLLISYTPLQNKKLKKKKESMQKSPAWFLTLRSPLTS